MQIIVSYQPAGYSDDSYTSFTSVVLRSILYMGWGGSVLCSISPDDPLMELLTGFFYLQLYKTMDRY